MRRSVTNRTRNSNHRRLRLESLESRQVLASDAVDDFYEIISGGTLSVQEDADDAVAVHRVNSFEVNGLVNQIATSAEYDMVAARVGNSDLRVFDWFGQELFSAQARIHFTDIDVTPDGHYLFALDGPVETIIDGTPVAPRYVHRLNFATFAWETRQLLTIAQGIEAIDADHVLLDGYYREVAENGYLYDPRNLTLNSFPLDASDIAAEQIRTTQYSLPAEVTYLFYSNLIYELVGSGWDYSRVTVNIFQIAGGEFQRLRSISSPGRGKSESTEAAISTNGRFVFVEDWQVNVSDDSDETRQLDEAIVTATSRVAFGKSAFYDAISGNLLGNLGFDGHAHHASDDGQYLWVYDLNSSAIVQFRVDHPEFGVLVNDIEIAPHNVVAELVSPPSHGVLRRFRTDGTFVYRPNNNFVGQDEFRYRIRTANGSSDTALVTISVTQQSVETSIPIAIPQEFHLAAGESLRLDASRTSSGVIPLDSRTVDSIEQIQTAGNFGLLFLRHSNKRISVVDVTTHSVIDELWGSDFSDMDLTPSGLYLFIVDNARRTILRYDVIRGSRERIATWNDIGDIEAMNRTQVFLLSSTDSYVSVSKEEIVADGQEFRLRELRSSRVGSQNSITDDELRVGTLAYDHIHHRVYTFRYEYSFRSDFIAFDDRLQNSEVHGNIGGLKSIIVGGTSVFFGRNRLDITDISGPNVEMPQPIMAAGPTTVFSNQTIYDVVTARPIGTFPFYFEKQFLDLESNELWAYDRESRTLHRYRIGSRHIGLLAPIPDTTSQPYTVEIVTPPTQGTLTEVGLNGTLRYIPAAGYTGTVTFQYRVSDGARQSAPATVTIVVHPLLVPTARPIGQYDRYETDSGKELDVRVRSGTSLLEQAPIDATQTSLLEYSPQFGVTARMRDDQVVVRNLDDGLIITQRSPVNLAFTDMSVTPDGRYVFVVELLHIANNADFRKGLFQYMLHRFDLVTHSWTDLLTESQALQVVAISGDRVLLLGGASDRFLTLHSFEQQSPGSTSKLSSISIDLDTIEYDPVSGNVIGVKFINTWKGRRFSIGVSRTELVAVSEWPLSPPDDVGYVPGRLSYDSRHFYVGPWQYDLENLEAPTRRFPEFIAAADDDMAIGLTHFYDARTGITLGNIEPGTGIPMLSRDGKHLWRLDGNYFRHFVFTSSTSGVLANDYDRDSELLTAELLEGPQHGTLAFSADGSFRYTSDRGFVGTDFFYYRASDGTNDSDRIRVTVEVQPPNIPPTISPIDSQSIAEDSVLTLHLAITDDRTQLDDLVIRASSDKSWLSTEIVRTEHAVQLRLSPQVHEHGRGRISIRVGDGDAVSESGFVLIVNPVNDRPTIRADEFVLNRDRLDINDPRLGLLRNDHDVDGDNLTTHIHTFPMHGIVELGENGTFVYLPHNGFDGIDSFAYTISDGTDVSGPATVRVIDKDRLGPVVPPTPIGLSVVPGNITVGHNETFEFRIDHDAILPSALLNDFSFRVHFDSSRLYYEGRERLFGYGDAKSQVVWDVADYDNDPSTDRFILFHRNAFSHGTESEESSRTQFARVRMRFRATSHIIDTTIRFTLALQQSTQASSLPEVVVKAPRVMLDVDDNGYMDDSDRSIIVKYLSLGGFPQFSQLSPGELGGEVDGRSRRSSAAQIGEYLLAAERRGLLDIDDDGHTAARTDGQLVRRYFAGLRGEPLVENAVGLIALRRTPDEIEARLEELLDWPTVSKATIDLNSDGLINSTDVDFLVRAVRENRSNMAWDLNTDLRVDSDDIAYFLQQIIRADVGDMNLDHKVDGADFQIWENHRFSGPANWSQGDVNGDGFIDTADYETLISGQMVKSSRAPRSMSRTPRASGHLMLRGNAYARRPLALRNEVVRGFGQR